MTPKQHLLFGAASERYTKLHYTYKTYNANAAGTGATPEKPYLQSFRQLDSPRVLTRMSAGLKADWRVTRNSILSAGAQINHFKSDRIATEFVLNAGTNAAPTPATGTPLSFGSDYTIGATGRLLPSQQLHLHHRELHPAQHARCVRIGLG